RAAPGAGRQRDDRGALGQRGQPGAANPARGAARAGVDGCPSQRSLALSLDRAVAPWLHLVPITRLWRAASSTSGVRTGEPLLARPSRPAFAPPFSTRAHRRRPTASAPGRRRVVGP